MAPKTQFQRWYGCDEVSMHGVAHAVQSILGTHVKVGQGIVDPFDDESLMFDQRPALPGVYVLRAISGWADPRNGYPPYVVGTYFDRVSAVDSAVVYPALSELEKSLGLRAQA